MKSDYSVEDISKYEMNIRHNLEESKQFNPFQENNGNSDIIEKILNEKSNKTRDTIQLIWILINEREEIKGKVLDGLESLILKAKNLILMAEPMIPVYTRLTRVQAELEKEIFKLEKAKLDEDVACWRDVLGLKKHLIGLRSELKSAENKANLFSLGNSKCK